MSDITSSIAVLLHLAGKIEKLSMSTLPTLGERSSGKSFNFAEKEERKLA